eukprot:1195367-Prorocentrum_minimum.AAC.5
MRRLGCTSGRVRSSYCVAGFRFACIRRLGLSGVASGVKHAARVLTPRLCRDAQRQDRGQGDLRRLHPDVRQDPGGDEDHQRGDADARGGGQRPGAPGQLARVGRPDRHLPLCDVGELPRRGGAHRALEPPHLARAAHQHQRGEYSFLLLLLPVFRPSPRLHSTNRTNKPIDYHVRALRKK